MKIAYLEAGPLHARQHAGSRQAAKVLSLSVAVPIGTDAIAAASADVEAGSLDLSAPESGNRGRSVSGDAFL